MFTWLGTHIYKILPLALLTTYQQHKPQEVKSKQLIFTL